MTLDKNKTINLSIIDCKNMGNCDILSHFESNKMLDQTFGVRLAKKNMTLQGQDFEVKLWDIVSNAASNLRTPDNGAIVIIYDVDDKESFSKAQRYVNSLNVESNYDKTKFIVGRNSGLRNRTTHYTEAEELASEYNMGYMEFSDTPKDINQLITDVAVAVSRKLNHTKDNSALRKVSPTKAKRPPHSVEQISFESTLAASDHSHCGCNIM